MQITKEWLKEKGACASGLQWFIEQFPKGEEYQKVLNALADEERAD